MCTCCQLYLHMMQCPRSCSLQLKCFSPQANRGSDEAHDSHQPRDEDAVSKREASGGSGILERAHVRSLHGREWATLSEQQRPDRQRQERLRQLKSGRAFGGM